ncbi:MAG: DUF3641 domain-containing protein [Planctomycetota bacterium]
MGVQVIVVSRGPQIYSCPKLYLHYMLNRRHTYIRDFNFSLLADRQIEVRDHCFACAAGAGSSCRGALTE